MKKLKLLSFKTKLNIAVLGISLVPLIMTIIIGLQTSIEDLKTLQFSLLAEERESKNVQLSSYFNNIADQLITLTHSKMTIDASEQLKQGFFAETKKLTPAQEENIKNYYTKTFNEEYKKKNGKDATAEDVLRKVSDHERLFQYAFTSSNPHPLGQKIELIETSFLPEYNKAHKVYHPIFKKILERFGLYDIFIIDNASGNIVYTALKELDFSTNLKNGPYAQTGLGQIFQESLKITKEGDYVIKDFANYFPSYELPASFIAAPIWVNGKQVATLAFQLPLDKIANIMKKITSKKTDVSFVIGQDGRLRSDIANNKEYTVENAYTKNKLLYLNLVQKKMNGPQELYHTNYNGKEVLTSITNLNFNKLN